MKTVIIGNRAMARHVVKHALSTGWDVIGVVAPDTDAAARQANYEPLDELVTNSGSRLVRTSDINDDSTHRQLSALDPDICLCPGWHQIIDRRVLDIPSTAFLGFHASRLPQGRGGAPVNWSLIHGADEIWLSLFHYTEGVDAGDVVVQSSVPIERRDDVRTVFDRLAQLACDILDEVRTDLVAGSWSRSPQNIVDATYRPRRQPQDGMVDWSRSAERQHDWIRAQTEPYPGVFTFHDGTKLTIWDADIVGGQSDEPVGTVTAVHSGRGVDVCTGGELLRLRRVQLGDGPATWADVLARRHGLSAGDRLGRHAAPPDWLYTGIRDEDGGTDFRTNLRIGQVGSVRAVADAPNGDRQLRIRVELGGRSLVDRRLSVSGRETTQVRYSTDEPGVETLRIRFVEDGEPIDARYLKLYFS
jgi:methionyl-tRNA formyltransferase